MTISILNNLQARNKKKIRNNSSSQRQQVVKKAINKRKLRVMVAVGRAVMTIRTISKRREPLQLPRPNPKHKLWLSKRNRHRVRKSKPPLRMNKVAKTRIIRNRKKAKRRRRVHPMRRSRSRRKVLRNQLKRKLKLRSSKNHHPNLNLLDKRKTRRQPKRKRSNNKLKKRKNHPQTVMKMPSLKTAMRLKKLHLLLQKRKDLHLRSYLKKNQSP